MLANSFLLVVLIFSHNISLAMNHAVFSLFISLLFSLHFFLLSLNEIFVCSIFCSRLGNQYHSVLHIHFIYLFYPFYFFQTRLKRLTFSCPWINLFSNNVYYLSLHFTSYSFHLWPSLPTSLLPLFLPPSWISSRPIGRVHHVLSHLSPRRLRWRSTPILKKMLPERVPTRYCPSGK